MTPADNYMYGKNYPPLPENNTLQEFRIHVIVNPKWRKQPREENRQASRTNVRTIQSKYKIHVQNNSLQSNLEDILFWYPNNSQETYSFSNRG